MVNLIICATRILEISSTLLANLPSKWLLYCFFIVWTDPNLLHGSKWDWAAGRGEGGCLVLRRILDRFSNSSKGRVVASHSTFVVVLIPFSRESPKRIFCHCLWKSIMGMCIKCLVLLFSSAWSSGISGIHELPEWCLSHPSAIAALTQSAQRTLGSNRTVSRLSYDNPAISSTFITALSRHSSVSSSRRLPACLPHFCLFCFPPFSLLFCTCSLLQYIRLTLRLYLIRFHLTSVCHAIL